MLGTMRGTLVPARSQLLALVLASIAATTIAARADDGLVDVRTLPRLEGAVENPARTEPHSLGYGVPTPVTITTPAIEKLLAADGWVEYLRPLEESGGSLLFKKGKQGLFVSFTQGLKRPDQSVVSYNSSRINADLPFPAAATNIMFDDRRPYLGCVSAASVDANLDFFRKELIASGWSPLSDADIAARWPNAKTAQKIENGMRAYYGQDTHGGYPQPPIVLSLQRRGDGNTSIEIKVAPFALPQDLRVIRDTVDLPEPDHTPSFGSTGSRDSTSRKVEGVTVAEIPVVLAFYRRELAARNWKEEAGGAVVSDNEATLNFSSPEQTATLKLSRKYDLTTISLVARVKEAALAARAKAKKDADDKFMTDAMATAKQMMAADEVRRAAQAANLSDAPLQAQAGAKTPVPLPENAENIEFDAEDGKLEFDSASSVKTIATFYRESLKSQGWKEQPSVINKSNMVVMEFSKAGKKLSFTAMQMGSKVNVSADGSGLVMANSKPDAGDNQASSALAGKSAAVANLEADPDSALPLPKLHTMSSTEAGKLPGTDIAFRRELEASIPAELNSVLAFYRSELAKRGWKESAERAVIKPDQVQLAFSSPDGPAVLKLGRNNDETTVNLAQKNPAAAAKGDVMPKPGQAKLLFGNLGDSEAAVIINKQTIKIAAGAGGPQAKGPTLELPPGKYQYSLKVAGGPVRNNAIEVAADDAWGLMIAPDGDVLSLHVY
ncbi:hypothetical protein [Bradyrhizobium sp. dw_411]|uniref:hypothetical protein n=1 Tax=Bradyrhizobium sp. dw_411 TaxID=2720082 RepID=UPI001BD02FE1|nr:hypothetical protein [Bradyrhizobium sp. dw_411]